MKKIGIIFAMDEEIDAFKKLIQIEKQYDIFDLHFYETTVKDIKCVLTICGVGKVNAARTTQILIDNYHVDIIFNIGVAGGISKKLKVGDIVIGNRLVQHDFDITAFNHEKGYIPNVGIYIESDEYLVRLAESIQINDSYHAITGVIASGDIFCTEESMSMKINTKFNALCVEMEGASIAQVCHLANIPFLILRSISDVPNNQNVMTYEDFLDLSSKRVSHFLYQMLEKINI